MFKWVLLVFVVVIAAVGMQSVESYRAEIQEGRVQYERGYDAGWAYKRYVHSADPDIHSRHPEYLRGYREASSIVFRERTDRIAALRSGKPEPSEKPDSGGS